jgi:glycosyltransferase involved in cell wall biosynthesis
MWREKTVSVVFPTYNEKDSIREAIEQFFASGYVDEVVVVNNNAAAGTSEEVAKTRAREVHEPAQGYGHACMRGLREATGDILILSEPDGTFLGRDVLKLLAYLDDFEFVIGTRTSRAMILEGANMGLFLKVGNVAVAKMTEVLFATPILTDMGCTMRGIHRAAYERIRDRLWIGGSQFGPHMLLEARIAGVRFMEIPVAYNKRVGESMVTGSLYKAIILGLQMIAMVWCYRIATWLRLYPKR